MLGWLWKKKIKPPTKEQVRQAKKLGINGAAEMSRATLSVLIANAEKQKGADRPKADD